ncbi:MAG: glycosyltransferase family 39 protein [Candidatus Aenigmarchaeota archaeon]|nr:glycosyltransferase family 39 protein [Candidatus Aenigmarchaeota archaeon]
MPNSYWFFILVLPLYLIIGPSHTFVLVVNYIFTTLSLFLIYKIGTLLRDQCLGLLSAFIFITFPSTYWFSKFFFLEIPLTTFLLATLLIFTLWVKMKKFLYFPLFIAFFILSILVKNVAIFFLLPFLIFLPNTKTRKVLLLVSLPVFLTLSFFVFKYEIYTFFLQLLNPLSKILSYLHDPMFYLGPFCILYYLIGPFYFVLTIFLPFFFLRNRHLVSSPAIVKLVFFSNFILYVFFFLFYIHSAVKNHYPLLSPLPLLLASFFHSKRKIKFLSIFLLVLFGSFYAIFDLQMNFLYGKMLHQSFDLFKKWETVPGAGEMKTIPIRLEFTGEERGMIFNASELEKILTIISQKGGGATYLSFSPAIGDALEYLALKKRIEVRRIFWQGLNKKELESRIKDLDYVIVSDIEIIRFPGVDAYRDLYFEFLNHTFDEEFGLKGKFEVINGLEVFVFEAKNK